MAKDDYFVIVAKILGFLYQRLKGKETRGVLEYIRPETKDFPIGREYMDYIVEHIHAQGLVERAYCIRDGSGARIATELTEETRITPDGIAYLNENSMIRRALKALPAIAQIVG